MPSVNSPKQKIQKHALKGFLGTNANHFISKAFFKSEMIKMIIQEKKTRTYGPGGNSLEIETRGVLVPTCPIN